MRPGIIIGIVVLAGALLGLWLSRRDVRETVDPLHAESGCSYDPATDKVLVDETRSAEEMALALAHCAVHAKYDQEARAATIATDQRAAYVRKMLDEEAAALASAIETKRSLEASGRKVAARCVLEDVYEAAYDEVAAAGSADRTHENGKAAGLAAVRHGLETSPKGDPDVESYSVYLGRRWDDWHHARGGSPAANGG